MPCHNVLSNMLSHCEYNNESSVYIPYDFTCPEMGSGPNYYRKLCVHKQRKKGPCYGNGCEEGAQSRRLFGLEPIPNIHLCPCGGKTMDKSTLYKKGVEGPMCWTCFKAYVAEKNENRKIGRSMKCGKEE